MNILQIYQKYRIMPSLQAHQLRVAAAARKISQSLEPKLDSEAITRACLLHDMGNILKFDLGVFPDFLEPEGLDYWQKVKQDFAEKYGEDEHVANLQIAKEIGVSPKVLELINAIGFEKIEAHFLAKDLAKMICEYADCRVSPVGIVSLEERLKDLEQRYGSKYPSDEHKAKRQKYYDLERQSEKYIFEQTNLKPEDLSEESTQNLITELKNYEFA